MQDWTSSLYLGFEHRASDLPDWPCLTRGKPAALDDPPGSVPVERDLAALSGCDAAVLAPSTLHLFVDLVPMLAGPHSTIFVDRGAYRISWWGIRQATAKGVKHMCFAPHDPQHLREALRKTGAQRPIVITDGLSIATGLPAPLADYAREAAHFDGVLVVDDTQALGIHGSDPTPKTPYGTGGGGSLRHADLSSPGVILVSSLAKGFGVPVAMLGGSAKIIALFRRRSLTRTHCSPPSAAVVAAARVALQLNRSRGDALRRRLANRVARFESGLRRIGLRSNGSLFPVRPLKLPPGIDPLAIYAELAGSGIRTVLKKTQSGPRIYFVVRASHRMTEIDAALDALNRIVTQYTKR